MWNCPKCQNAVDDSFEVCWSCGTTADGIEDPEFVTADDAAPIEDPNASLDPAMDDLLDDFAGTPLPDLVECYTATNSVEAKFIADRLMELGIPAVADRIDMGMTVLGASVWRGGPKIRVRPKDVPHVRAWLKDYEKHRKMRQSNE
jgi:hypothetical protein